MGIDVLDNTTKISTINPMDTATRKIVPGINDLMNNNPRLVKEWDYEKTHR